MHTTSQANCSPWGNILGMRVDGQLVNFETSLRLVSPDWSGFTQSSKYNWDDPIVFTRHENTHISSHALMALPITYKIEVRDSGTGSVEVMVQVSAHEDVDAAGLYFCVEVPAEEYTGAMVSLLDSQPAVQPFEIQHMPPTSSEYIHTANRGLCITSEANQINVAMDNPLDVIVRQDFIGHPAYLNDPKAIQTFVTSDPYQQTANVQCYFALISGKVRKGQTIEQCFQIEVTANLDQRPIQMMLNVSKPGRKFDGIGGNFRLQFPDIDPQIIRYCLDTMRVAWGRIAMWWEDWHPDEDVDPVEQAKAGKLKENLYKQMELARELTQCDIPIIVSVWFPPAWAVKGHAPDRGLLLDDHKMEKICASITSYLTYLKETYGVEVPLFSFNEPDVGVEVRQVSEVHALFAKSLGEYFASKGLVTKFLLGDTGHGTAAANRIVEAAVADPDVHKYIGAVAYHSWHGCTHRDLAAWTKTANQLNVPLMMTEGGPDSAAHRYPLVFTESWFELQEIDLYLRICAESQPITVMPWQLTADYSVLTGDGVYGGHGPLQPTQRYWNLKQLATTPQNAFALPITCDRADGNGKVSCAAFGNLARGEYAIHMVNNGAARRVTLSGLPQGLDTLRVYVTDHTRGMQELAPLSVVEGQVSFNLESVSYTSLFGTMLHS